MLWPLIARSLYRLARFRIFSNPAYRSVLFGCGVSLIGIAFRADMSLIAWFRALLFGST